MSLIASVCVLIANAQAFKASSGSEVKLIGAEWKNVKRNWDYYLSGIEEDRKVEKDMQEFGVCRVHEGHVESGYGGV